MYVLLTPTIFASSPFGFRLTKDKGGSLTHFLFLHYFGRPCCRVTCTSVEDDNICANIVEYCAGVEFEMRKDKREV